MSGLSALDLLALSEEEQLIVRGLVHRPGSTLAELAQLVPLSVQELEVHVKHLLQDAQLVEQQLDGQRIFSVRFKRERQRIRNISPSALDLYE
jgi:hypothetical protein